MRKPSNGDFPVKSLLLADDHEIFRNGLKMTLRIHFPALKIFGSDTLEKTCCLLNAQRIPLVVLDLIMPGTSGLEGIQKVRKTIADPRVLVLSALEESEYGFAAWKLGAVGCLNKTAGADAIAEAIRKIAEGGQHFGDVTMHKILQQASKSGHEAPHESLSNRELQVLMLLAQDKSVKETAYELQLSNKTVFTYRTRIYHKLAVDSPVALTRYAMRHGLVV